ncbi:MAG: SIS domain-containing protein [Candidatus Helarchaeota archaeon]|nr:SIS domain-containing protein [Candidatus Helarchaeota archaeon]
MGEKKKILTQDKRVKEWGIAGDEKSLQKTIEETSEHPMMYRALGTEPKTSHPFNLFNDIHNQAKYLEATLSSIRPEVSALAEEMIQRKINKIIGIGMGTSQFIALVTAPIFWKYAGIEAVDMDSCEAIVTDRPMDDKTAFFAYSGSGTTIDTIDATKKAKQKGAFTVAITSIDGSPLTKVTDKKIVVCAETYDTGGSDTFHYATRLAVAIYLAIELGKRRNPEKLDFGKIEGVLRQIPVLMASIFDEVAARCWNIAKHHKRVRSIIIVGSGPNYGTAEEIGLKFDEMAHIPTNAMVPTRHIHGALGLTNERILTIILAPLNDPAMKWLKQIADATRLLKSPAIGIVSSSETEIADMMDYVIRIPTDNPELFALLSIVAGQLLAYFFAVEQGNINPDCQRSNIPKYARVWLKLFPPGSH